jgi:hypothetical protein
LTSRSLTRSVSYALWAAGACVNNCTSAFFAESEVHVGRTRHLSHICTHIRFTRSGPGIRNDRRTELCVGKRWEMAGSNSYPFNGPTIFTEQVRVAVMLCTCIQKGSYSNLNHDLAYLECFVWVFLAAPGKFRARLLVQRPLLSNPSFIIIIISSSSSQYSDWGTDLTFRGRFSAVARDFSVLQNF